MFLKIFILLTTTLLLASCDSTIQYGVYVANSTGEDIIVSYKTENDEKGTIEKSITLKDGQQERIIWTTNLEKPADDHCQKVAKYINATMRNNVKSNLKWCSDDIKSELTDVGQREYTIRYKPEHFDI